MKWACLWCGTQYDTDYLPPRQFKTTMGRQEGDRLLLLNRVQSVVV